MKTIRTILGVSVIVAITAGIAYLLWFCGSKALAWFATMQEEVLSAIVAAVGTVLAGVGAVVFSQQRSKKREIAESHRPIKVELYNSFIHTMIETLIKHKKTETSGPKLAEDEELQKFFSDFNSRVILWGSPAVIRKYAQFRSAGGRGQSDHILLLMDDLMKEMRRDLDNSNRMLKRGDLIKLLLTDPEGVDEILGQDTGRSVKGHSHS